MKEIKPCGFYILIELMEVNNEIEEGPLKGLILSTDTEQKREQKGEDTAKVLAIGPTAFADLNGISGNTAEERAAQWGVEVGDLIQMDRYEGTEIRVEGQELQRLIPASAIKGVFRSAA